ncbi:MAG TPA: TonB-dependent receptor plug domain-containing protein [Candidatus Acidoferrum sp.]|nr:TonB-dependent receptor plug domain-containing protein [Candidatus Acidoferrum sp.]
MKVLRGLNHRAGCFAAASLKSGVRKVLRRGCLSLAAAVVMTIPAWSQETPKDLGSKSIEELMNIEVTSPSKKTESLLEAPAAIFVVTGQDILRGGYSSIPDALRMVPGLHVAQQSSHVWLVSARGFSSLFNAKMLVLIDGRLAYTPTFGGVWWDVQDPPLEDIDRIEVIRGPGGTLWGANAVNGVINIITKEAGKTQGVLVASTAGVNEGYATHVRYGGTAGKRFAYRIYGTGSYWLPSVNPSGAENYDTWSISQGGTRIDWNASEKDTATFDGQGYSGRLRDSTDVFSPVASVTTVNTQSVLKGGHVLGRWKHAFNDRSSTDVLGYCDWTARAITLWDEQRSTCDIEVQHNYSFTDRQALTWGGSILSTNLSSQANFRFGIPPPNRRTTTYSMFLQYDFELVPGKLRVIAGSKFDHNAFTGFEYQPQLRVAWTPTKSQTVWAAVSRAVRTPTLAEVDGKLRVSQLSAAPLTFLDFIGNSESESEVLHSYELGYRYGWKKKFSLDGTVYYNAYDDLLGPTTPGAPIINPAPFYIDVPLAYTNAGGGQTHGLEAYFQYKPIQRWTLSAGITELRGNSVPGLVVAASTNDPRHILSLDSKFDLTQSLNFDAAYYYYDAITHMLPPVNRVDIGISTKPIHGFTFSAWGRNLQADRHQEATPFLFPAGEIRRSVVFKLIWQSNVDPGTGKH